MFSYITSFLENPREMLIFLLLSIPGRFMALSLHEFAHAWMANRCGDPTARMLGRLTVNPARHLDPVGTVMMLLLGFGWAKPVPVNMYRFQNPKRGMAITALAGPVSNVLLAIVFLFLYGVLFLPLKGSGIVLQMIYLTAYISIAFAIFNIIPISPLDGSKVLFSLLPSEQYDKLMHYERYGMLLLLVVVTTGVLGKPLTAVTGAVFDKLFVFAEWGYELISRLY